VQLEAAGHPKANRSAVLQEAVEQLRALVEARGLEDSADLAGVFPRRGDRAPRAAAATLTSQVLLTGFHVEPH
jgi:hypothetical protein